MGKLILVSGENNSGKSIFAESLIAKYNGKRYYIATMIPATKENTERIKKHKKQREGLNFITLELPYRLNDEHIDFDSVVLLEDVSNFLANNIFDKNNTVKEVFGDILKLKKRCEVIVAVTISGLRNDGYDEETANYIKSVEEINKMLYDEAFVVIRMINGKPVLEKGESYDVF